jgi:hypothetical protein
MDPRRALGLTSNQGMTPIRSAVARMHQVTDGGTNFVFRGGSRTNEGLTPRPVADTTPSAGQLPGLSVEDQLSDALGDRNRKAQKLDVSKLKPPLAYIADDPATGGRSGHGVITPVDAATGQVDIAALEEWASQRASQQDTPHPLTQLVIDAIVESDLRRT